MGLPTDPGHPFCGGAVGWGGGGPIQSKVPSQRQGEVLGAGPAWPEGGGEEAIRPIFC